MIWTQLLEVDQILLEDDPDAVAGWGLEGSGRHCWKLKRIRRCWKMVRIKLLDGIRRIRTLLLEVEEDQTLLEDDPGAVAGRGYSC